MDKNTKQGLVAILFGLVVAQVWVALYLSRDQEEFKSVVRETIVMVEIMNESQAEVGTNDD